MGNHSAERDHRGVFVLSRDTARDDRPTRAGTAKRRTLAGAAGNVVLCYSVFAQLHEHRGVGMRSGSSATEAFDCHPMAGRWSADTSLLFCGGSDCVIASTIRKIAFSDCNLHFCRRRAAVEPSLPVR